MCQSIGPWVCCVCVVCAVCAVCAPVCVCVISNQSTSKNQTLVNLTPCCIKHTSMSLWYQGLICVDPYYHYVKLHIKFGVITQSAKETTERAVGVGVWNDKKVEGLGWGWVGNMGGVFIKQGGQHPSANYVKSLKKFPISAPIMKLPPPHSWLPPFLVKIPPAITAIFEKFHPPLYEGWAGVRTISISQQF